jgi:hypothetical protein
MSSIAAPVPASSRTHLWPWLVLASALVVVRTLPYVLWGTLAFDADQAVVGLMSKHIAEFRALPVYQYALPYVVIVSAYVTAPFMWLFGPTIFALKLPLLLMNVAVGLLVILAIVRAGLRPGAAVALSLPLLLTSAVVNASLMDALGMTVEPLLFVIVLWYARRSPVLFGLTAALGFHVREFVAYGVAAIVAVDVLAGDVVSPGGRRRWALATLAALGTTAAISGVARFGSIRGPDTWLVQELEGNLATLGGAFCFVPRQAWRNVQELALSYLGILLGAVPRPLSDAAVQTRVWQGLPGAWAVLGLWLVVVTGLLVARLRILWTRRREESAQLGLFLVLVGLQSVLVYAISRCGPVSVVTIRYALMGVFLPTGLALLAWTTAPPRALRTGIVSMFVALAGLNGWTHLRIWQEQLAGAPLPNRVQLAQALEARGIRYARSDYWTAYYVDFLSQERVTVGADTLSRVDIYERALEQHATEVVRLSTQPCGDAPPIVPGYHVCRDSAP